MTTAENLRDIAERMLPGETVADTVKRLGWTIKEPDTETPAGQVVVLLEGLAEEIFDLSDEQNPPITGDEEKELREGRGVRGHCRRGLHRGAHSERGRRRVTPVGKVH